MIASCDMDGRDVLEVGRDALEVEDYISCDPTELELVEEVSVVIEHDSEKILRLHNLLIGSASGSELFFNCTNGLPTNSGASIGRNVVMNRVLKFFVLHGKVQNGGKNQWRSATPETLREVENVFAMIEKGSAEWNNVLRVMMTGVELPKNVTDSKRKLTSMKVAPIAALPSIAEKPIERQNDSDRVALLACALVDRTLTEFWIDLFSPIPKEVRPAVLDNGIKNFKFDKWNMHADRIMRSRHLYSNDFFDLTIEGE